MVVDFVMHVENVNGKKVTCICSGDSSWELSAYYPKLHRGMEVELYRNSKKWYVKILDK